MTLENVADSCYRSLENLDSVLFANLKESVTKAIDKANQPNMKEIGRLSERLQGLEHLLAEAKELETVQRDLAKAFVANQQRLMSTFHRYQTFL